MAGAFDHYVLARSTEHAMTATLYRVRASAKDLLVPGYDIELSGRRTQAVRAGDLPIGGIGVRAASGVEHVGAFGLTLRRKRPALAPAKRDTERDTS